MEVENYPRKAGESL